MMSRIPGVAENGWGLERGVNDEGSASCIHMYFKGR